MLSVIKSAIIPFTYGLYLFNYIVTKIKFEINQFLNGTIWYFEKYASCWELDEMKPISYPYVK